MAGGNTEPTAAKTPTTIKLRIPSKYQPKPKTPAEEPTTIDRNAFQSPPLEWLWRTWAVTHSTLSMWRSARNVRITYAPNADPPTANDNLVEYENQNGKGGVKSVAGLEKPDPRVPGAWNWRGKGWLAIASSHWEILGWGERPLLSSAPGGVGDMGDGVENWVVTWFAPTLFTQEGVDIYSDRKEGISQETFDSIMKALTELKGADKLVNMVKKDMREVQIQLPWQERK
ncbi:hypothetical protein F4780DRAFT_225370 [Xylariomycetidae sp. FL0641]|nr:hypothetical protein F4780DRAFT_225370 [Xylariomycetidae sp. FL0641]